jgi:formate hydrogenlyase regulatory protein HycA
MTFGLIDESAPDRRDWAELHPDRLGFNPPWDGTYNT